MTVTKKDDRFDRAFDYLVRNEGGYTNNHADSGGPTKYGVTLATLARWRKLECSATEVQALTRDEAKALYRALYWEPLRLDEVEKLVIATAIFDAAVLFGARVAAVRVQKVLLQVGVTLRVDGLIGPRTLDTLNHVDETAFIPVFQAELRERVADIVRVTPKNEVFRGGWDKRIDRLKSLIA